MMLSCFVLLILSSIAAECREIAHRRRTSDVFPPAVKRCRTTQDFERVPWLSNTSTFHNLGHPLIKTLCKVDSSARNDEHLGCKSLKGTRWLHSSEPSPRRGPLTSKIVVDPHLKDTGMPSSGAYVINSMFGLLYELGYEPGVRHWSTTLNNLFPPEVVSAALNSSNPFDVYEQSGKGNPYAATFNWISMEIEVGMNFYQNPRAINESPYGRVFKWIIGLHFAHNTEIYLKGAATSHCLGANHFLGQGQLCSSSEVLPCPQYFFHQDISRQVNPGNRAQMKQNIILFDNDQGVFDPQDFVNQVKALGGVDDLVALVHAGRARTDTPALYMKTKITIDCRNPGVEFINYEAVMYDVMTLSCNLRATRNVFDFPVPSKYHIDPSIAGRHRLVKLVHSMLVNYTQHVDDFKYFKHLALNANTMASTAVDITYFSRDVVFRTSCGSYAECRRTMPWAVAIWTLFPLARIEVVVGIELEQYLLDNDVVLETLHQNFNSAYFKAYGRGSVSLPPADLFPRFPCQYLVYMDPSFVPFSRDFLNSHIEALVADPEPILYWRGAKLVLAVMKAKPYLITLRESPGHRTVYMETGGVIRPIENWDTLVAITTYVNDIYIVGTAYLPRLPGGPNFNEGHLQEMVKQHPRLPTVPCNSTDPSPRCVQRKGLVIDALYVPMPHHDDDDHYSTSSTEPAATTAANTAEHSGENAAEHGSVIDEPHFWLTSSTPRVPLSTVLSKFSLSEVEAIVTHLDPILQNAHMQKIIGFIPQDIAHALKLFDANLFPNVVSLIDADNQHWGDKC